MKLAGAPISWGVCEVPGWGLQLPAARVLDEMRALGLAATEAGPPGFLPEDAAAARALLERHGLRLVGGFVTAVLHDPARRGNELAAVDRQAAWLAAGGAEVLVLACATGRTGYSTAVELDDAGWTELFRSLEAVAATARRHGLAAAVHPHWGTAIERARHIDRFLEGCVQDLCLDTGHVALGGADPLEIARRAGPRVRHVHLKDVDRELAQQVRDLSVTYDDAVRRGLYRRLGEGAARVPEVLDALRAADYGGWYVLERDVMLDRTPAAHPDGIERDVELVRRHAGV